MRHGDGQAGEQGRLDGQAGEQGRLDELEVGLVDRRRLHRAFALESGLQVDVELLQKLLRLVESC